MATNELESDGTKSSHARSSKFELTFSDSEGNRNIRTPSGNNPMHDSDTAIDPEGGISLKQHVEANDLKKTRGDSMASSVLERESNLRRTSSYNPLYAQNSKWLTSFLLVNTMIGSGILNQPYVFMNSGIVGGLAGFIVASYMTWACVNMLTETGIHTNTPQYQGIARLAYGDNGEKCLDVCVIISCFGSLLGYIIVVGSTLSTLLMSRML